MGKYDFCFIVPFLTKTRTRYNMMTVEELSKTVDNRSNELLKEFAEYSANNKLNLSNIELFQMWSFGKIGCLEVLLEDSNERQAKILDELDMMQTMYAQLNGLCVKLTEALKDLHGKLLENAQKTNSEATENSGNNS